MDGDKRKSPRQRTLKGARIVFSRGSFTYDCVVKNLSATGALLIVPATDGIPNRFQLVLSGQSRPQMCDVAWRSANRLGVTFSASDEEPG